MSLVSNLFLLFVLTLTIVYYIVPARFQWVVLLVFSYLYYISGNAKYLVYIVSSTVAVYLAARLIDSLKEKGASAGKQKLVLVTGLVINLGLLCVVKYLGPVIDFLNSTFKLDIPGLAILMPLGISFYTFQSSGYLIDVYWGKVKAEKNLPFFALFVSFFPQLLQGPIGKFERLAPQFREKHPFDWENIRNGTERIIWGYCKKMILADWAGVFADAIWGDLDRFNGVCLFALLFYGIQLYADFSGAMDVVIGVASLFGIRLDENFRRPYLATSVADFWKRWHITLGDWMMSYVFYPISLSGWMMKFSKWCRRVFGKKYGRVVPIALADVIVFLLVGIWHGASWKYVFYGLLNGGIIAFSELMVYNYRAWKKKLHISGNETWFYVFSVVRTFIIVNLRWFFDRSDTLRQAFYMIRQAFTHFDPSQLLMVPAGRGGTAFVPQALAIIIVGSLFMVLMGIRQEKGHDIQKELNALPLPVTFICCMGMLVLIGVFGCTGTPRGFIYAQF